MRIALLVLLLTLSTLVTAQSIDNGLTAADVVEHLDVNETNLMSTAELLITILFGWLAASYFVARKLTQAQFAMAVISYSAVTISLLFQVFLITSINIAWMERIGFIYLSPENDYLVLVWRVGLPLFLYIVSLYFAFSIRRDKSQSQIDIREKGSE